MTDTDRSVLATVIDSMIALEREACAKIAEGEAERICKHIAAAIRARGTP